MARLPKSTLLIAATAFGLGVVLFSGRKKDVPPPNKGNGNGMPKILSVPGVTVIDNRGTAPTDYFRQKREPTDIRAVVLHQTGFDWEPDNKKWREVRAHYVVRKDGSIVNNWDPTDQMKVGSNHANPFSVTIEHEGNFANDKGVWWEGDKFGKDYLEDRPAEVQSARNLIAALKAKYPSITHVYAHRQWDAGKGNCPGPSVWRAVGEWAKSSLGLSDGGPGWAYENGLPIPDSWRVPWEVKNA